jgi:hypothetical protein
MDQGSLKVIKNNFKKGNDPHPERPRASLHFSCPIATDFANYPKILCDRSAPRFFRDRRWKQFSRVVSMEKGRGPAFTREFMLRKKTMGTRSYPTFFSWCDYNATSCIQPSSRTTRLGFPEPTQKTIRKERQLSNAAVYSSDRSLSTQPHETYHQKRHVAAQPQASPAKLRGKTTKLSDDTLRCGGCWDRR